MNGNIIVSLQNINISYGENSILENLNLEIKDKEFLTLLGPSGCGGIYKTRFWKSFF